MLGARGFKMPVLAVGTDEKMVRNSERMVDPGVLTGAPLARKVTQQFSNPTTAANVLAAASVLGSIVDEAFPKRVVLPSHFLRSGVWRAIGKDFDLSDSLERALSPGARSQIQERVKDLLAGMFEQPTPKSPPAPTRSACWRHLVDRGVSAQRARCRTYGNCSRRRRKA